MNNKTQNELADLIFLCIREARSIEELAERLVDRGVQIVPEGAIILTRAEIDALNEYTEKLKREYAKEIFEEIEAIPMENMPYAVCLNIHNKIAELKKKYTEEGK